MAMGQPCSEPVSFSALRLVLSDLASTPSPALTHFLEGSKELSVHAQTCNTHNVQHKHVTQCKANGVKNLFYIRGVHQVN